MRSCIFVAKILMLGLLIPSVLSCSSGDETPPYTTPGSKPSTNYTRDAGTGSDGGTTVIMDCSVNGTAGCPCTGAGATADCGRIDYISGDYVTCVMGTAKCDGTQWGTCAGNRIVAQNYRRHSLTTSGIQLLSLSKGCDIPCDPACTKVTGQQMDVDAGTLTFSDAGISITGTTGAGPGSGPCKGLWCQVQSCQGKPKTSLSGKVYDPAGKNPLYNAYVYVPVDPTVALPAFSSGASCDTCSGAGAVSAIAVAQTGPDGSFTLNNIPAGAGVALVVQMGKWRRMVTLPAVTACANNPVAVDYSRLPRNHTDGYNNLADIPKIAIASGSADPFECLLLKAGIDPNEIKPPGNNTRIEYYVENGIDRSPGGAPSGSNLTGNLTTLKTYDVVLLPCEGKENDAHVSDVPNLASFADIGGRIFTTHYGYSWLATPKNGVAQNKSEFYGTADWSKLDQGDYRDPMTSTVDQSFPKGVAFAQWLQNLGATTTLGSLTINEPRHDARSAKNPPSQRWVYGSSKSASAGVSDMLLSMTFNTPTAATQDKQCGRVVYSDFHVSADALASTTKASCTNDNGCGFTSTCNGEALGTCSTKTCEISTDCAASGFSCGGSVKGNCTTPACYSATDCPSGRTCSGHLGSCGLSCLTTPDCSKIAGSTCGGVTKGTCSALTCKADTECGVGTCNGETVGSCGLTTTKSCWATSECTSLNSNTTCSASTGTCSTACKSSTDCGTGTCSGTPKQGTCVPPTKNCWGNSDCTSLNAGATCSGGKTGTCAAGTCKVSSDCGSGSCSGAVKGICKKNNGTTSAVQCFADTDCAAGGLSASYHCNSATLGNCSLNTCEVAADCGSRACNNAAVGTCVGPTGHACWLDAECSSTLGTGYTCSGEVFGTCPAKSGCTTDASCGGTRTCAGSAQGTCTYPSKSCWAGSDCGTSAACNNAVIGNCSSYACTLNGDCGSTRTCQNAIPGACTGSKTCKTQTDCSSWGATATCNNASAGTCNAQACSVASECGTGGSCVNGQTGTCQEACTSDAQCGGNLTCVSGQCAGCYAGSACPSSSCPGGVTGTCSAASSMFPLTCLNADLSAQEKALEFMLFDLSACVSPDSWTPPVPGIAFAPVTFNLDFMANCPSDKRPIWREFDWQSQIPSTANIMFKVQTADSASGLTAAQSVALASATSTTALPGWDVAIIDTTAGGAFQKVDPPITSRNYLRVATTLNPTPDLKASPTLINWEVHYDCVYSQ